MRVVELLMIASSKFVLHNPENGASRLFVLVARIHECNVQGRYPGAAPSSYRVERSGHCAEIHPYLGTATADALRRAHHG